MPERHFPPPWSVQELEACFIVTDSAGQKLAFVYFEEEPGRRSATKSLTRDEARRPSEKFASFIVFVLGPVWQIRPAFSEAVPAS